MAFGTFMFGLFIILLVAWRPWTPPGKAESQAIVAETLVSDWLVEIEVIAAD